MSDDQPPRLRAVGSSRHGRDQEDHGSPFTRIFGTDTPETLAARIYEQMRLIWGEQKARAALESVIKRKRGGRPARQDLQPNEEWMLGVYDLWSTIPGNSPDHKLEFARYFKKKFGGQSVAAIRKRLDRLIEFADRNP